MTARVAADRGRRIEISAELRDGDELLAEADGAFLHVPLEHFLATPEGAPPARPGRSGSGAAREGEPGQDLAHDPLGDERGHVGRADRGRQHLDDVGADEVAPSGDLAAAGTQQVAGGHPARLGRARPGRERGVEHVDVDGQERRAVADDLERALDDRVDPELADVVHEERRDPALGLPGELVGPGPVAAEADLDVPLRVDVPSSTSRYIGVPCERSPPKTSGPVSVCVSKWTRPTGPTRAATARMFGSEIEWSPPSTIGIAPGVDDLADERLDRRVRPLGVGGQDRRVAEVDDPQLGERVDAHLEVRPGGQLAARIARGPKRVPGRSETRSSVGAPTIATSTPSSSAGVLRVGRPAEREQPGVVRLLRRPRPRQRSSGSIIRRSSQTTRTSDFQAGGHRSCCEQISSCGGGIRTPHLRSPPMSRIIFAAG